MHVWEDGHLLQENVKQKLLAMSLGIFMNQWDWDLVEHWRREEGKVMGWRRPFPPQGPNDREAPRVSRGHRRLSDDSIHWAHCAA